MYHGYMVGTAIIWCCGEVAPNSIISYVECLLYSTYVAFVWFVEKSLVWYYRSAMDSSST